MPAFRNTADVVPCSTGIPSLVALRNLEGGPSHQWDEDERALLSILNRWYDDADPTAISKVFNEVTGLNLRHRVIRNQFRNHIVLYGGRAFPEFQHIISIPFDDPGGVYHEIRTIIEETAVQFGISLARRTEEVVFNTGQARIAKSAKTRKYHKSLVRRAAEKERERLLRPQLGEPEPEPEPESEQAPEPELEPGPRIKDCVLGYTTLAVSPEWDFKEAWFDVDEPPPFKPLPRKIGFRVWDDKSRTTFSETSGFVSEAFARFWTGDHPPPFSPRGQGLQALKIFSNLHLSLSGGASTFVSVSTSLLQAMVKASAMENPRIAIVALDHPLLKEPNKTMHAAEIMQMLKGEGLAWWARYKGIAERMIWASLPAATILSHFPLADLKSLSNRDKACSDTLSLECIQPGRRTRYVSSQMRSKNKVLDIPAALAIASISRTFGMHRKDVSLAHIQALIASLVDSLYIHKDSSTDEDTTASGIASAFAVALRSRGHVHEEVMQAFQEGVRQGFDTIEYYSGRGRGGGRGRRRAAAAASG
ncbi:hypothetical protein GMOD_00007093 [Pyrenophora seminiperda CCB06]|uniref:DUF7587 domain-containing protein n=1 Tax=Pyrenophora seminiperda CCB06 TaxID=1302712 RepID=A0A3M7MCI6_9PLEO|nr:hypothetical protein GMOD_00007093 [Pyrenophora seminiperda CCB06]